MRKINATTTKFRTEYRERSFIVGNVLYRRIIHAIREKSILFNWPISKDVLKYDPNWQAVIRAHGSRLSDLFILNVLLLYVSVLLFGHIAVYLSQSIIDRNTKISMSGSIWKTSAPNHRKAFKRAPNFRTIFSKGLLLWHCYERDRPKKRKVNG